MFKYQLKIKLPNIHKKVLLKNRRLKKAQKSKHCYLANVNITVLLIEALTMGSYVRSTLHMHGAPWPDVRLPINSLLVASNSSDTMGKIMEPAL